MTSLQPREGTDELPYVREDDWDDDEDDWDEDEDEGGDE